MSYRQIKHARFFLVKQRRPKQDPTSHRCLGGKYSRKFDEHLRRSKLFKIFTITVVMNRSSVYILVFYTNHYSTSQQDRANEVNRFFFNKFHFVLRHMSRQSRSHIISRLFEAFNKIKDESQAQMKNAKLG